MSELDLLRALVLSQQQELSDLREEYNTWVPNYMRYECHAEPLTHRDWIYFVLHKTFLDNTCALLASKTKRILNVSFPRKDLFCSSTTSGVWVISFHTEKSIRQRRSTWSGVFGHSLVIQYHPHSCRNVFNCKQTFSLGMPANSWRVPRVGIEVLCRTLYETYARIDPPSAAEIAKLCAHFEIELV